MPKRRAGGNTAHRIALLHALAHIELNAIDLAWDIQARFQEEALPLDFYDDWVQIALEEAEHFERLQERLRALGSHYGALPAHDGLWQAAQLSADDLAARLALVPMVLEARALDVTPATLNKLRPSGDSQTLDALTQILEEEVGHVAAGRHWFDYLCDRRGLAPQPHWRALIADRFPGRLKPPYNWALRQRAGFDREYLEGDDAHAAVKESKKHTMTLEGS